MKNTTLMPMKNLFPSYEIDEDKHLLYKLDANAIYADERGQKKCLAMIKIVLDRRPDLKSEVYNQLTKNSQNGKSK